MIVGKTAPVDERAVGAPQIAQHVHHAVERDRGVPAGDVEIFVGVELQLTLRVPADADVGLAEYAGLAGLGPREDGEFGLHAAAGRCGLTGR
jgi:hypothetical protein